MPIKSNSAKRQALRFQGMSFWDLKRIEMENAYRDAFDSDHDAECFTAEWLQMHDECPLPVHIWDAAKRFTLAKRENEARTGFKCELCKDLRFLPINDRHDGSVGLAHRCVCNPETDESSLRGHYVQATEKALHPEIVLGIPAIIVTAKPAFKSFMAKRCQYEGPLTIRECVDAGQLARENAIGMVKYWIQEGGDVPTGNALIQSL